MLLELCLHFNNTKLTPAATSLPVHIWNGFDGVFKLFCRNEFCYDRINAKANVKKKSTAKAQTKAKNKVCMLFCVDQNCNIDDIENNEVSAVFECK